MRPVVNRITWVVMPLSLLPLCQVSTPLTFRIIGKKLPVPLYIHTDQGNAVSMLMEPSELKNVAVHFASNAANQRIEINN